MQYNDLEIELRILEDLASIDFHDAQQGKCPVIAFLGHGNNPKFGPPSDEYLKMLIPGPMTKEQITKKLSKENIQALFVILDEE